MTDTLAPRLGASQADWIQGSVSIIVGSRNAHLHPHLMRGLGCRVAPDRRRVTVLMAAHSATDVIDDLRDNASIAVVFTQPSSNRALQLKGNDASIASCSAADEGLSQHYLRSFIEEISQLGFAAPVARNILAHQDDLVAITFTIASAFEQTPGPQAGQTLPASD